MYPHQQQGILGVERSVAGDVVMASAALDRLLQRCTVVNMRGESYRLKEKRSAAKETGRRIS
jgi:DNA replication protein DnaC